MHALCLFCFHKLEYWEGKEIYVRGLRAAVDWAWVGLVLFSLHRAKHSKDPADRNLEERRSKHNSVESVCVCVFVIKHTHTHARTHARTHACTHACMHMNTMSCPAAKPLSTLCVRACACMHVCEFA